MKVKSFSFLFRSVEAIQGKGLWHIKKTDLDLEKVFSKGVASDLKIGLAFLSKTSPTLPLIGYTARLDAFLMCLAMLVEGKQYKQTKAR